MLDQNMNPHQHKVDDAVMPHDEKYEKEMDKYKEEGMNIVSFILICGKNKQIENLKKYFLPFSPTCMF